MRLELEEGAEEAADATSAGAAAASECDLRGKACVRSTGVLATPAPTRLRFDSDNMKTPPNSA